MSDHPLDTRPLRIAVLNQREGGGATAVALDLLGRARAAGHHVEYFPNTESDGDQALARAVVRFAPDVVHAHCFYNLWSPEILRSLSHFFPVVFTIHDVYAANQYGTECWQCTHNPFCLWCPALPVPKRWYSIYRVRSRIRRDRAWRKLRARIIYPSTWMQGRMASTSLARLPGQVIHYGVDPHTFAPDPGARERLGLDGRPTILAVGNMYSPHDDRKGYADLFAAFAGTIRPTLPEARLIVVGKVLGLTPPPGCELLGDVPREQIASWHAAADVFALPSLGDNLPVAILEAMASGTAVVASRVGGIPEQVEHGATGLVVPPRDPRELGAALVDLLRDDARRRMMGSRARQRIEERFSQDIAWRAHAALYAECAKDKP